MEKDIANLRKDYSKAALDVQETAEDPIQQFRNWFEEALKAEIPEPSAMIVSTSTPDGRPSARVLLLKDITANGFVFFTNYNSRKGQEIEKNPFASFTFFWSELERQVRIEGKLEKTDAQRSDEYFQSRPRGSQLGAWASPQSEEIPDRGVLETKEKELQEKFQGKEVPRPEHWGGYELKPNRLEFWQGRQSRLHDRIVYERTNQQWSRKRLAP